MKTGFTLIELSIVLVVIGLIVGGVLVGQDMIRSAQINSIVSDLNRYTIATTAYKLKYNQYPGDHKNAYQYFDGGATNSICGYNNTVHSSIGCNGDNDGVIGDYNTESYRYWQHLQLAGLIEGSLTGEMNTNAALGGGTIPNLNAASSSIKNAAYLPKPFVNETLLFIFAGDGGYNVNSASVINPIEALQLERKMGDDGLPSSGFITGSNGSDAISSCVLSGAYVLTNNNISCRLYIEMIGN